MRVWNGGNFGSGINATTPPGKDARRNGPTDVERSETLNRPGTEQLVHGAATPRRPAAVKPALPHRLGPEVAGVEHEVGAGDGQDGQRGPEEHERGGVAGQPVEPGKSAESFRRRRDGRTGWRSPRR